MKTTFLLAHMLVVATLAYVGFAWLQRPSNALYLVALASGAAVLLLSSLRLPRGNLARFILPVAASLYSLAALAALALQVRLQMPIGGRVTASLFLFAGLLLGMRALFVATRPSRLGYGRYFDPPASSRLRITDQRLRSQQDQRPDRP